MRLDIYSRHLARYSEEINKFLQPTITGDETWVHYYQQKASGKSYNGSIRHILLQENSRRNRSRQVDVDLLPGF
jgi:hypothetical protein